MKILFVSFMGGGIWGGSEELWYQTALHLHSLGHEVAVSVYRFPKPPPAIETLKQRGVLVQQRNRGRPTLLRRIQHRLRGMIAPDAELIDLSFLIRSLRPDYICASNGIGIDLIEGLELIAASGVPWCNISQCGIEWSWPTDSQATRARQLFATSTHWFFVAERNRQLFETQWGIRLERTEIVRNPFKVNITNALPWPLENNTVRLACVARHDPVCKGQDLLLEVLAQTKWRDRPIRLSLFGEGERSLLIHRLVDRLGLSDRVDFHGHVDSIEDIWRTHHALILPSRHEGLPLALVEAALCGRPAIVTDVGGNSELIANGISGFIAPAPTVACLDDSLEHAWTRCTEWPSMGLAARKRALDIIPSDPVALFSKRLLELANGRS
jgi:glycosyltransferase involved in cell wall biosynthesis